MSDDANISIDVLRHSAAHLLAHAVLDLYPETKTGIGPAVETGFYYDFLRDTPFTPEDLEAIEKRMKELARANVPVERLVLSKDEAIRMFEEKGQPLKVELIREKGDATVTVYGQGPFADFCLGPHVPSTGLLENVKLLSVSGRLLEGRRARAAAPADLRRRLPDEEGARGSPAHARGGQEARPPPARRRARPLQHQRGPRRRAHPLAPQGRPRPGRHRAALARAPLGRAATTSSITPHIGRATLWQTSGHLGFYKDSMYSPMDIDEQTYYLKPMNCPFHIQIYKSRMRSYRDLPLRWAELGTVYRYERSGTLHGLLRVRGFTQDDAHIICTPEQIEDEILRVLDFSVSILADFGFTDNKIELSVRDPKNPAKYAGLGRPLAPGRSLPRQGPGDPRLCPTSGWRARPSSTVPRSTSRSRTPSAGSGSARPSSSISTCPSAST